MAIQQAQINETKQEVSQLLSLLPEQALKDVLKSYKAPMFALPPDLTRSILPLVTAVFSLILVGTAAALIFSVFIAVQTQDNVQIVLTLFTTAAGFLGGLFTPSPLTPEQNDNEE